MSGRSSERERRQAAQARLAAAGITSRPRGGGNRQGLVIAGVILVVALVAGLVYAWQSSTSGSAPVPATYQASRQGTVVTAGAPNAPVTVAVYEDFLCPACQQLERSYGGEITTALNQGKIKVQYHLLAILDDRSSPAGYSSRAGSAGLCAADAGIWPAFHEQMFADQPAEGSAGRSTQDLVALGTRLGARGGFASCVTGNGQAGAIVKATDAAAADPVVAPGGRLATPTVVIGGKQVDVNDRNWLSTAIGGS